MTNKPSLAIQDACQVLRYRVMFGDAVLRLPGSSVDKDDTQLIRDATRLYVETWIVPVLDAIERGDTWSLKNQTCRCRKQRMDTNDKEVCGE